MKKLKECKRVSEILEHYTNDLGEKISYILLFFWCLIPILILLTTMFVSNNSVFWFNLGLYLTGGLGLINGIIYIYKNKEKFKVNKQTIPLYLLILFIIWTFISCILAENKNLSFFGMPYRKEGFITYIFYIGFFINGLVILNKKYIKRILTILLISSSILCFLNLLNNNLTEILVNNSNLHSNRLHTSIFSNENHFAYYLTIGVTSSIFMFIWNDKKIYKILSLISYLLLTYILIKNDTLGSYLAIFVNLIFINIYFFMINKNKERVLLVLAIFLILSLFSSNVTLSLTKMYRDFKTAINKDNISDVIEGADYSSLCTGSNRVDLWVKGTKLMLDKPIFGYGLDNLLTPYSKVLYCEITDRPHNTYLQVGMTSGIIGLLLYIIPLVIILFKNLKEKDEFKVGILFIVLGYLMSAFFGNSMFYTSPYYIFLLGVLAQTLLIDKKLRIYK